MKRIIKKIILSAVCVVLVFAHVRVAIHAETNTCTVTFFASYETEPETVVVNGGTLVEKPNDPERQYYEFAGWYKDSAYTEAWDFENDLVMNDMTLYAKWNYHLLQLGIGGDGFGRIADAAPGEELVMEEEYHITSAFSVIPGVHKIAARADEGSEFVEWRYEDGRTYSTDAETTVELGEENITLNAIFKILPYETATLNLKNGVSAELYPTLLLDGVLEVLFTAGELSVVEMDPIVGAESLVLVQDKDGKLVYIYDTESERFAYGSEYHNISYDITDEVRNRIQQNITEYPDNYDPEMIDALQNIVDYYKTVEIVFEELHVLNISMEGIGHITYADAYEELSYAEEDLAQNIITTYIGEYKVAAVADDPDYAFEKWVVNGKDYSTDKETTIYLEEEDLEMVAVFKLIPTEKATLALRNGVKEDYYSNLEIDGVLFTLTEANQIQLRTAYEGYEGIENVGFVCDPEGKLLFIYNVENGKYYYGPDYHDVTYEISDEIRAVLQERVAHPKEDDDAEFIDALQQIVEFYKTVEITFAPLTRIEASVGEGGGFITYADEGEELSYNMEDLAQSIVTPYAGDNKFGAVPNKGYSFVKWIKDGEDYSTDKEISVTLEDKDIELKAIFKHEPGQFIYKEQEDNLGKATIADKTIDLNATLNISLEEVEAMNEGEDIYLILRSKENSAVATSQAKSAIEKKLTQKEKVGLYFNLSLERQLNDSTKWNTEETISPFTIEMKLNPELCKEGRTFKLVYYNGETVEEIESNVTGSEEGVILSFPTTRFGQFALLYTDKEETKKPDVTPKPTTPTKKPIVNTGIEDALAIYGWLFILSLMSVIGCLRIQKKHN